MAKAQATVNLNDTLKQTTIKIKTVGVVRFKLRLKVAMFFFWLGAKVSGMGIEFTDPAAPTFKLQ